jgi:hypothetical protein
VLAEFQQAMCDLIASPQLCSAVRADPEVLRSAYELTDREAHRLVVLARDDGMTAACSLYRANRLAPLVMNVPRTCRALGGLLRPLLDEYWTVRTETNVHFFVECDRFCAFLETRVADGLVIPEAAQTALTEEAAAVRQALAESQLEAQPAPDQPDQRSTSMTITGPDGGRSRYCG